VVAKEVKELAMETADEPTDIVPPLWLIKRPQSHPFHPDPPILNLRNGLFISSVCVNHRA